MNVTGERLTTYYTFSDNVLEGVAAVAEHQQRYDRHTDYFEAIGLPEPERFPVYDVWGSNVITTLPILDIRPAVDYDETKARVMHQPMANPLDPNMLFQAATIFQSDPTERMIVIGNPGAPGYDAGVLAKQPYRRYRSVSTGDLSAIVDPETKWLTDNNISKVDHIGYSYGAEKAAVAAFWGTFYRHLVGRTVHIEPVSVVERSLLRLGLQFGASQKALEQYVNASHTPAFIDARQHSPGLVDYSVGLARLTNIGIAKALARGSFESRMEKAQRKQPDMVSTIIWGSESELAVDGATQAIVARLQGKFGSSRLKPIRLQGQKHALANDIHLQAALVLEGLAA